jgi:hypothetical protein
MAVEIELRVKSGPGEIIANRKFAVVDGVIDVTGIQFSEPGEYEILVISNSEELENTEFTINILPEEEVIPQDEPDRPDEEPVTGKRPIIAQIDPPTYKLNPIEFDSFGNEDDDSEVSTSLGFIPLFSYNNSPIESRYIQKMIIYYEDFVPKCQIIFKDALGLINSDDTTPLNDAKFDVFLNSGSDILKSIHLKFKLEVNQRNKSGTNTITGILDIPDFYKIGYKSYGGTSFNSLRKLCKELQIGFNSNIENTDDSMIWRRNGITTKDFIKNILEHSYISDDSFMVGYIDYYWSFNYVNVEKEWARDISDDVGLISQGVSSMSSKDKIAPLILTDDKSSDSSPFYIKNIIINNNSTLQSTKKGNFTVSKVYDRKTKSFLIFNVDSLSSNTKDQVVLKGAPGDKNEFETNFRTSYGGRIDTSNVHENWAYSVEQNKRNLTNLSNITLQADLPNPNYNLYKFQKVKIIKVNQKQTVTNDDLIDQRISGDWIIIDIKFIWSNGSLIQSITCSRKELGKTTEEKQNQIIQEDESVNNSEINENPSDPELPNQRYEIGGVYTLQDADGIIYLYTVTRLDDNGVDVIGDIERKDGQSILKAEEDDIETEQISSVTEQEFILFNMLLLRNTWTPGELQKKGTYSESFEPNDNLFLTEKIDIIVEWRVINGDDVGFYNGLVDNNVINTFNNLQDAIDQTKDSAFNKFTKLIDDIPVIDNPDQFL